jgi:hypothetical protein
MANKKLVSTLDIRSSGLDERYFSKEDSKINFSVIRLVLYGFSTAAIANKTGLTYSQVQYRVRMYKLQGARSMFRMGETEGAKTVMQLALRVPTAKREQDKMLYQKIRDGILDAYKKEKVSR